eukprot:TRINITY_DN16295_c0_g1_i5.p2 TRINITY_DN16295_c0_g1~~TRINITY_DN16295_c0_g1_i5.p2  ORF type:complete len:155 (-),score=46.51 TRINITY_DN16295_c0_g1_i5:203-619(-)
MAFGPFVRILVQVGMVAGNTIGRAVMEAYKEAAAGRGAAAAAAQKIARRRMSLDEARKVFDVEASATEQIVQERFETLHKLNAPTEDFVGSPYLQARVSAARTVILEHINKGKTDSKDTNDAKDEKENKDKANAKQDE